MFVGFFSLTCFANAAASYYCYLNGSVGHRIFRCWIFRDGRHVLDQTHFFFFVVVQF